MELSARATEKKSSRPFLVFDKEGSLGSLIAKSLAHQNITVFVSGRMPEKTEQLVYVPWKKQIPSIPNSAFSLMYLVYNGDKRMLDLLPSFVKKAKQDGTHIYFLLNVRDASDGIVQTLIDSSSVLTILLIGDIFDGDIFSWENPVSRLLHDARRGSVLLPSWGLPYVYPVHMDDVMHVIVASSHRKDFSQVRMVYVLPPHPVTMLSFARTIAKQEPLLHIDFSDQQYILQYAPSKYLSVFGEHYEYEKRLPLLTFTPGDPTPLPTRKMEKRWSAPLPRVPSFSWWIIVCVMVAFLLSPLFAGLIGGGFLLRTKEQVDRSDISKARSSAVAAHAFFSFADTTSVMVETPLQLFGLGRLSTAFSDSMKTGLRASTVAVSGVDGFTLLKRVFEGTSTQPEKDFSQGIANVKQSLKDVAALKAEGKVPEEYAAYTEELERATSLLTNTYDVLPEVFGMNGKKTYLILFQNNMELRPGGGFIGSYALMGVEKGKIATMTIHDVYDADGQLKEHVEPPFQLRRYLGSQHWFLRDSNFAVDFPQNAAMAAYFYNLEMGKKVDGVFAVDVSFVRNLIRILGPLKLSEFNETVTDKNFFLLTESYVENDFFPGSTQKKDFLLAVYKQIFFKVTEEELPYDRLLAMILTNIQQKHILIAFPDNEIQRVFSINGFSSTVDDTREGRVHGFNDFVGINEANIGLNKTNYYIDRSIRHSVQLDESGKGTATLRVQYQNRSNATSAFGGDYKNYVRFVLPRSAVLESIVIDGNVQTIVDAVVNPAVFTAKSFRPDQGLEVERTEDGSYVLYGFLVTVPMGAKKEVGITYTLPMNALVQSSTGHYSLRVFKQPGTESDPYLFSFAFPTSRKVLKKPQVAKVVGSTVSYISDLSEDRILDISLTKK